MNATDLVALSERVQAALLSQDWQRVEDLAREIASNALALAGYAKARRAERP